jgi:3-oxoacyl-[acyl-carrier protein] reductase
MRELAGRVALVTGAARNIGHAIALTLAEAGAAIAINAHTSIAAAKDLAAEITDTGGRALVVPANVADEDEVRRMVEETAARFGGLDILVNNAASRHEAPINALDFARWRGAMAVMLDGPFLAVKAALPYLRKSVAGTIVNMGGMTAQSGAKNRAHVVAAKAGLEGLTRALALELADAHITVNCVSPGLIDTVRSGTGAGEASHRASRPMPLGRLAPPLEVAAMVRHLCWPNARFITGQVIHVNGGNYLGG